MRWMMVVAALLSSGCHTMRFEVSNEPHQRVVFHRKSFFFWGLTPTAEVDVSAYCPAGVTAIREQTQLSDGFFDLITLGIWAPRSSWYYCLDEGAHP